MGYLMGLEAAGLFTKEKVPNRASNQFEYQWTRAKSVNPEDIEIRRYAISI
jgi:hypothetical protein